MCFFILNHSICKNGDRNYLTLFCYCYYFVWLILWSTDSLRELSTKCRCFVPESGLTELDYFFLHWCRPLSTMKSLICKLATAHNEHAQFQPAACTSWCTLNRGLICFVIFILVVIMSHDAQICQQKFTVYYKCSINTEDNSRKKLVLQKLTPRWPEIQSKNVI